MGGKKTVENSRRFEKDRRDKLNVAFMELCKLLPDHDPSVTLSKMEILRKAAEYIKFLQEQNDEIMKLGEDLALKNESEKLRKRVAHLLLKTKELVDALRCAGVPIPTSKRRKRKPKTVLQDPATNQNKLSVTKQDEAKTSKDEATTIKKVKCGCMKLAPEKKPLKESNPTVTSAGTMVTLGNIIPITCASSVPGPPWTNHTKLLTVTPTPLISASVMTTRVQNVPVVKQILPNTNNLNTSSTSLAAIPGGTLKVSGEGNGSNKNLPVVRSAINSMPIVPSNIQAIPIISNNLIPPNINKEVASTFINKKTVNIVTTTSSNSLPTQTIVNSTHLITLSQSNIISAPVVAPGIQTVPVLEKNILSNLGPGTLILADGRIMNVPPIVPQILVKPQPTVILMPSTKKKEKILVPKRRDVTKTTYANKAPIPAIQTFRLESCPKVRPKKKPKTILRKTEKSKSLENDTDSEQVKKKRKINNLPQSDLTNEVLLPQGEHNKISSLNGKAVDNKDPNNIPNEKSSKDSSLDELGSTTNLPSGVPNEVEITNDSSVLIKTSSTPESSKLLNISSPSAVTSSTTEQKSDTTKTSDQISTLSEHSDSLLVSQVTTETSVTPQDCNIPILSNPASKPCMETSFQNADVNQTIEDDKHSTPKPSIDVVTVSGINQSSFNPDSSEPLFNLPSMTVENNEIATCAIDVNANSSHNNSTDVSIQSDTTGTSVETQLTSPKTDSLSSNLLSQNSISTTSCSDANTVYPTSLTETNLSEVSSSTVQDSIFASSNEKNTGIKLTLPSESIFAASNEKNSGIKLTLPSDSIFAASNEKNSGIKLTLPSESIFAASNEQNSGIKLTLPSDSIYAASNEKNTGIKLTLPSYSSHVEQDVYKGIDLNQDRSGSNCFQREERINSHISGQSETQPVCKSSNTNGNDTSTYSSSSLVPEGNQQSKPIAEISSTTVINSASIVTVPTSIGNEKIFPNRELLHSDLPDLGSNALVDNSSMFPQINDSLPLSGQEKVIYSQAKSFQQDNCVVNSNATITGINSLNMAGNKNSLPTISNNSFNQQQTNISQLNHTQMNQTKLKADQPIDPFCTNPPRQDAMVYSQSNTSLVYSKANESFSNHPTYGMSGTLSDKSSNSIYNNTVRKPVNFNPNDKLPCSNPLPVMPSMNQVMSSNTNIYSGYCSANFYPTTTVTYSQNSFTLKSANKSTSTLTDNATKKIIPYSGFNDPMSMNIGDKQFYTQSMPFHHNSLPKSNCNKTFYSGSNNNLQDDNTKDKNSFQFGKMTGIEKQNESPMHNQLMYLGFQNETIVSQASGFFQNFSSTGINDIPSGINIHNSTVPSKSINHHENSLSINSTHMERNSQEKTYISSQNNIDKNSSASNIDKESRRNTSFYPALSQPHEAMEYTTSCPEPLPEVQSNSFDRNSIVKSKKTSETNCLSRNNLTTEKNSCVESHKVVTSSSNTAQINSSHSAYNNIMSSSSFAEGTSKTNNQTSSIDERRKVNEVQNTYPQEKEVSKCNRFTETAKLTCNPPDSSKTNTLYSVNVLEKENISQNNTSIPSASSKSVTTSEAEQNPETGSYNNYVSKTATNGKNIQNSNSEINNISQKINDSIENVHNHYKSFIGNSNNSEKQLQENHKIMSSSTYKTVSTEMNSDDFQTFHFNSSYQKLLQSQTTSFTSNSSRIPGSSVRSVSYANFENVPYDPLNNHYNSENGPTVDARNTVTCSTQNMNHPSQLLPPTTSASNQVVSHSNNKTAPVSVMTNSLSHKENRANKICPPVSDGASFKGDISTDFLKSKDIERNTFIPIIDDVRLTSDFSSDLFSSLQVPTGGQNSESISPTAAFLLAFPLVSTSRNIENLPDNENHDNQTSTPTTILQIGNIEPPSTEMFHPIEFQKNTKGNDQYEINNDYIQVADIHNKHNTTYNNKPYEKRKDVFPDYNKDQRTEPKAKPKPSTAATNSYGTQSYNYSHFSCNDYQQYCGKEGAQWQQEFPNISKEQKKTCEKKKDKGVQKGCFYQNYQEYYSYKDKKRKQQNRISVNWMTTSENREQAEYQAKEPEITNNYAGHSSQPVYSSIPIDFPTESFSDFGSSKKTNNYSWSPSKTLLPALDNHLMIPSTLPTLVGDLALGTSTPSESYKTFEAPKVQPQIAKKHAEKMDENKKRNDFPKSQANFFSVSQLVDPKSKKQKTTDRNYKRQEKASKPRANFNCSKRKDDHCMYYEDRNNFVANQNQNQCNDKRHPYKGGSYSAESLIGAQQTEVDFSSNFNYQQNSNYFQSDFTTSHIDSGQQYGYFQQTHFSGFSHDEYQDFGFSSNQRSLDQNRQKIPIRKDDNYQGAALIQPQIYPSYSKSIHYNLPSSQLNTNTTTTLTNFNLSTIFPEMNDQRVGSSGQTSQQMNPSFTSSQTYRSHLQQ